MPITKCIIPIAGYGTRMLPSTKAIPKEMLPIADLPVIHYLVQEAADAGITDVCIVTARHKRAIEDYFDRLPELEAILERDNKAHLLDRVRSLSDRVRISYVRQNEPRGSGDAILAGRTFAGGDPVLVLYGDDLIRGTPAPAELLSAYERVGTSILSLVRVADEETRRVGIVEFDHSEDRLHRISRFLEKPAPTETESRFGVIGKYVITPDVMDRLGTLSGSVYGETFILALSEAASRGRLHGYELSGRRYDTGNMLGYLEACLDYSIAHPDFGEAYAAMIRERVGQGISVP
ncbi:MAG TPA: UTP--glucose-1-phosphate uridylyltransferase [bacterium]|nr:UTP--glucose-1-phosphate uridylyltransferase [bacterium]